MANGGHGLLLNLPIDTTLGVLLTVLTINYNVGDLYKKPIWLLGKINTRILILAENIEDHPVSFVHFSHDFNGFMFVPRLFCLFFSILFTIKVKIINSSFIS